MQRNENSDGVFNMTCKYDLWNVTVTYQFIVSKDLYSVESYWYLLMLLDNTLASGLAVEDNEFLSVIHKKITRYFPIILLANIVNIIAVS